MRHPNNSTPANRTKAGARSIRIGVLIAVLSVLGLLGAAPASASIEQVGVFAGSAGLPEKPGVFPEEVQLGGVGGMAVNRSGAGGVAPGTLYTVGYSNSESWHAARYSPDGKFELAWNSQRRCGPKAKEPAHPTCPAVPVGGALPVDIEIDQTTGNVYVFYGLENGAGVVRVYSPDASKLIAQFGLRDIEGTIASSPEKLHGGAGVGRIAVEDTGKVYVVDEDKTFHRRLMVFEPETPGDYEHYEYTGEILGGPLGTNPVPQPVLDDAGNIYVAGEDFIAEYDPAQPTAPICSFSLKIGGIRGFTVNPAGGEPFYYTYKNEKIHQLSACDSEGKFVEVAAAGGLAPKRDEILAMTFNPERQFGPGRPAGVLYAGAIGGSGGKTEPYSGGGTLTESALGFILAPPLETPPKVLSQSVSQVTSSTASLNAQINPKGSQTHYAFQYIDDAAYAANEPDERQALTVKAGGGVFGLSFEGARLGGPATATLTSGSKVATALQTATATATLEAASGQGDLNGATGKGTVIAGSGVITSAAATTGSFEVGQGIAGEGIPDGTTILAIEPEEAPLSSVEIEISNAATKSAAHTALTTGTNTITALSTSEGSFEVGQAITGIGIPAGTQIAEVKAGELVLSKPVTAPQAGVKLQAGSSTLSDLSPGIGSFEVGQVIEGTGIPAGATILAIAGNSLTLSKPVTKPGTLVAIGYPGPYPLAVGERIEGPGIGPDTTIESIKAGELTLSVPATASGTSVALNAGLPASVSAAKLRSALEALSTIGEGNVKVSGGPGDEAGSSPYEITFTGAFENVDVPQLSAASLTLSAGSATATVQSEHDGGSGFAQGASEAPAGGGELGSGQKALSAAAALTGLAPGTGYHYRVIATSHCSAADESKVCEDAGPAQGFRTQPVEAPKLPDDRAWELVSPTQKNGGEVLPANPSRASCGSECKPGLAAHRFPIQVTSDGEAIAYEGSPFSLNEGPAEFDEYVSRRSASGWQTASLSPPLAGDRGANGFEAFALSSDLSAGIVRVKNPALTAEAPAEYLNLFAQPTDDRFSLEPLLTSTNASLHRLPGNGNGSLLLFYAGASKDLSRVFFRANDALTEETPFAPEAVDGGAAKFNLYEWSGGRLHLVNVQPGNAESIPEASFGNGPPAISADGSRVFWSSEAGQVYVRENGETTKAIPDAGKFLSASVDGSKVLLSNGHLYDLESETSSDLTAGKGGFQGLSGQSEDLSSIYFVDSEVLDETPNEQGAVAEAGKPNLYAWQEGSLSYVATLLPGDNTGAGLGAWQASPVRRAAEASPDGRWLTFGSKAELTGVDGIGPCAYEPNTLEYVGSVPCEEVFLYDSQTGKLSCPSCNPVGEHPHGGSFLPQPMPATVMEFQAQLRYLTDSGRLYFDSRDSLSANDTNGKVEDVYQYEPQGIGSCEKKSGCVSLISAGHEPIDSNFLAMDEGGKNVFFTTRDQLVLKDKDDLIDLYVAREGGGIASETETGRSECQGEACQAQAAPPNDPTPGSSSFEGAGNVDEQKAKKKKSHKKKHKARKHAKKHKRAAKHNRGGAK